MAKYTDRLRRLASHVAHGEVVADIGPDHGYLGILLLRGGVSPRVIMADIAPGPLSIARANFEKYMASSADMASGAAAAGVPDGTACADGSGLCKADFRLGDGLAPLGRGEADAVVIAGMGGETIIEILEADPDKTRCFPKYILQPRTKVELLREWLGGRFEIAAEDTVEERGRDCAIIVAKPL